MKWFDQQPLENALITKSNSVNMFTENGFLFRSFRSKNSIRIIRDLLTSASNKQCSFFKRNFHLQFVLMQMLLDVTNMNVHDLLCSFW